MKIGVVPYLNGMPLTWGLKREVGVELLTDVPSKLAAMLEAREIAAGLVSSAACFENPALRILPEISISCDGRAESVKLFHRTPLERVRTVALDRSSLTSTLLVQIVLQERYKLLPEFVPMAPQLDSMLGACDAALVIGDATMMAPQDRWPSLDLGEEWNILTGLPFVFAVWAVDPDVATSGLVDLLARSKQHGLRSLQEISEVEAERLELPVSVCHRYLSETMNYDLTERHLRGLELFRQKACSLGLATGGSIKLLETTGVEAGRS